MGGRGRHHHAEALLRFRGAWGHAADRMELKSMVCEARWSWKPARIFNLLPGFLAISGVTQFAKTATRPLPANPGDDGIEQKMSLEYGGYVFHAGGSVCVCVAGRGMGDDAAHFRLGHHVHPGPCPLLANGRLESTE